ncbi:MAG: phospholipase D-like domain-containing protein [Archaeoglobaceae archaeon]
MKLVFNYEIATIKTALLDNLLNELALAKSGVHSVLWLISPWIKDFEFSLRGRRSLAVLLGEPGSSVSLLELLEKYSSYGGEIRLVSYPPHMLFDAECIQRIIQLLEIRKELEKSKVPEITLEELINVINKEINMLTEQVTTHVDVIRFQNSISTLPNSQVYFNERLHAKIILGTNFSMIGSANITPGGFIRNDEVYLIVDDANILKEIKEFCENMIKPEGVRRYFVVNKNHYDIHKKIDKELLEQINMHLKEIPLGIKEVLELSGI